MAEEGNIFTRKLGPLPVWVWATIVVSLLGAYAWWQKIGPFAPSAPAASGYDAASLPNMLGSGAGANLGTVAGGGPADPNLTLGGGVSSLLANYENIAKHGPNPAARQRAAGAYAAVQSLYPGATAGTR